MRNKSPLTGDDRPVRLDRRDRKRQSPVGWSLAIAGTANITLGVVALMSGSTATGIMTCTALALLGMLLVFAEVMCRAQRSSEEDYERYDDR